MSGEDDTFDIDIYGDESETQQNQELKREENPEDRLFDDDETYGYEGGDNQQTSNDHDAQQQQTSTPGLPNRNKRKADEYEEDNQPPAEAPAGPASSTPSTHPALPTEPNATPAIQIRDLHWWTTEEDVRHFCAAANVEADLKEITFGEHKINGKSRGEAYLEFSNASSASAVKKLIEERDAPQEGETEGKRKHPFQTFYCGVGNPFKGRDSGQATKKDAGAYNAAPVRGGFNRGGGGFQARGAGGFNRGGGGFQGRGGYQNQNQQAWGMNGGNMGGYGQNPMMAMTNMGGMGMGMGYNPMMGGRGGFAGGMPNMGNMMNMGGRGGNMMGGRGGNMMGARGGWGGGFNQGAGMQQSYGGGYGMQQQGSMQSGPNKKMRNE